MADRDRMTVVPTAVKAIGNDLQGAVNDFTSSADAFNSAMSSLIAASKGDGPDSIDSLGREWTRAHKQITTALNDLGIRTQEAGDIYEQGRTQQNETVRGKGGQMNFHVNQI